MTIPYTPPKDHVVCVQCKGPIPSYRHGLYATCSRSCSLEYLGLWSDNDSSNARQLDQNATIRAINTRDVLHPERNER